MSTVLKEYNTLLQQSLRWVANRILTTIAEDGIDPNQEIYISFKTTMDGVVLPAFLLEKYPEEITIVIEKEYYNLKVNNSGFSIELIFNDKLTPIYVPFNAMTSLVDAKSKFVLPLKESVDTVPISQTLFNHNDKVLEKDIISIKELQNIAKDKDGERE
ncbi:MAG: hypothetical protein JJV93_02545 [Alphaproteobacteria bacterium]|nr:hypothetical protein [Alphaproteobacteria bacterium]MBL0718109.1 hypothetical protein [Alphaproteobacteria bacterium]